MKQSFVFVSPSFLEKMRNGTHFNFMSYIQDMIQDYSTENTKFLAYLKEFNDALAREDNFLVITRKSDFTVSIHEADTMRDSLYYRLKHFVLASCALSQLPEYEAAMRVKKQVDAHGINSRWKLGQKSGILTNFIKALEEEKLKADIEELELTHTLELLKEQNEQVKSLLKERSIEMGKLKNGALEQARKATDKAYFELTDFIESMCNFLDDEKLITLIDACNVEIKRSINEATLRSKNKEEAPTDQAPGADAQGQQSGGVTDVKPEQKPTPEGQTTQPGNQSNQPTEQQGTHPKPQPTPQEGNGTANQPSNENSQHSPGNNPSDTSSNNSGTSGSSPNDTGNHSGNSSGGTSQSPTDKKPIPSPEEDGHTSSGIITEARPA